MFFEWSDNYMKVSNEMACDVACHKKYVYFR